jgi:hypothetical protein
MADANELFDNWKAGMIGEKALCAPCFKYCGGLLSVALFQVDCLFFHNNHIFRSLEGTGCYALLLLAPMQFLESLFFFLQVF